MILPATELPDKQPFSATSMLHLIGSGEDKQRCLLGALSHTDEKWRRASDIDVCDCLACVRAISGHTG